MNKKLLALAVAAAVAPVVALADGSTVTLTGVVNGSYENYKQSDNFGHSQSNSGIGTNATRWNINGSEDLGDGLKAIFSLAVDQAFATSSIASAPNGAGTNIVNRNSFIGLAGDSWGSIKMGQNEHEYEIQTIKQDPFPASENNGNALTVGTRFGFQGPNVQSGFNGFTRRDAQSIWYATPDLGGFLGNLAYITPSGQKNDVANISPSGWNLGLQYAPPGLGLTGYFGYASYKDWANTFAGTVQDSGSKDTAWHIGLGYTIADLTLNVQYEHLKESGNALTALQSAVFNAANVNSLERKNWLLSADYRIGAGAIKALYERGNKLSGGICNIATLCDQSVGKLWTIGYWHDLSKRTSAYVDYYKMDNGNAASFMTEQNGISQKGLSLGLRTTF